MPTHAGTNFTYFTYTRLASFPSRKNCGRIMQLCTPFSLVGLCKNAELAYLCSYALTPITHELRITGSCLCTNSLICQGQSGQLRTYRFCRRIISTAISSNKPKNTLEQADLSCRRKLFFCSKYGRIQCLLR